MRTIVILSILLSFAACESTFVDQPFSDFSISQNTIILGDEVEFQNLSRNAYECEWDFGDGSYSYVWSPIHIYNRPGTYEVRLTVFNDEFENSSYFTIDVFRPTSAEIIVKEYIKGYPVPNASVLLYPTLHDWDNETNSVVEGITDKNGITVITNLDSKEYYLDIWHEFFNNYALADADINFIKMPRLRPYEMNTFIAWVDYVDPGKKKSGTLKIRRLERIEKNIKNK